MTTLPKNIKPEIVPDEEMEEHMRETEDTTMVCIRASEPAKFADNVVEHRCFRCNELVQERPHNPKGIKRLCLDCLAADLKERAASGEDVRHFVSETTAKEFFDWRKRKRLN